MIVQNMVAKLQDLLLKRRLVLLRTVIITGVVLLLLTTLSFFVFFKGDDSVQAAPWAELATEFAQRKQITLVNHSGSTIDSGATYTTTIDTKALFDAGQLQSDCSDIRIFYQPSSSQSNKLEYYVDPVAGETCATSVATKIYFALQANLTTTVDSNDYYVYFGNTNASSESTIDAFDMGSVNALLACPLDGDTTCVDTNGAESPTTETGAIRYSESKTAMQFDSESDFLSIGSPTNLDDLHGGAFTAEAWVKWPGGLEGSNPDFLMGMGSEGWRFTLSPNTGVDIRIDCTTTNAESESGTDEFSGDNIWHHVAFTFDYNGDKTIRIYIDGTEVSSYSKQVACDGTSDPAVSGKAIGSNNTGGGYYYSGALDEFRISNIVRYTSNFSPQTTPFVPDGNTMLLYHFDEFGDDPRDTGKVFDSSEYGNHGTVNGDPNYVAGVVGIDGDSSPKTGNVVSQSFASHNGVMIEYGTTNLITNPSFEYSGDFDRSWDAVGGNLTLFEETSAPYYKFGSASVKLVASGTGDNDFTITIDPDSTSKHSLLAYVYDGTAGNIGGTVDATVAELVFEGSAVATTYFDMGGGWWRLLHNVETTDAANEYGIQVKDTKTVYVDAFQLDSSSYQSYADGSLGADYAWSGTAHDSTSTRTGSDLIYDLTGHASISAGSVSFWIKPTMHSWHNHHALGSNSTLKLIDFGSNYFGGNGGFALSHYQSSINLAASNFGGTGNHGVSVPTTANQWHHIVATWDGTNGAIYIDGAVGQSGLFSSLAFNTTNLEIGDGRSAIIGDFVTYDNELTSDQVADLYNVGLVSHQTQISTTERFGQDSEAPVMHLRFDEGYGTTAYDSSPSSNDGTISGATWQTEDKCISGKCLYLDGTNDYVSAGFAKDLNTIDAGDSVTYSMWVRSGDTDTSNYPNLIGIRNGSTDIFNLRVYNDNLQLEVYDNVNNRSVTHGNIVDNKWHHIVAVKDNDVSTIYVDGQESISTSITTWLEINQNGPFYMGTRSNSAFIEAFIDEVKVYSYARTAEEIRSEFVTLGSPHGLTAVLGHQDESFLSDGLVGYWKMDESTWSGANSILDSSGNGHDLTPINSVSTAGGKYGSGGDFTASSNHYLCSDTNGDSSCDDEDGLDVGTSDFTISAWVKRPDNGTSQEIVNKGPIGTGDIGDTYDVYVQSTGKYISMMAASGYSTVFASNTVIDDDTWHHVVTVFDRDGYMTNYVDGVYDVKSDISAMASEDIDSTDYFAIAGDRKLDGNLDEVRFYKRTLTPDEVVSLYEWAPGPVAYYPMDDAVSGDGQTILDVSGNENHGTTDYGANTTGMDCTVSGQYGGACEFDGNDDYVQIASDDLSTESSFSISTWIKPDSTVATGHLLWQGDSAGNGWGAQHEMHLSMGADISGVQTDDKLAFFLGSAFTTDANTLFCYTNFTDTTSWSYVTVVVENLESSPACKLYLNGNQIDSDTGTIGSTSRTNWNTNMRIGRPGTATRYYNGLIDDIRIYNYALSPKQITNIMNARPVYANAVGSPVGSPIMHLPFDEGFGDSANDHSPNTNNADLGGSCPGAGTCPTWTNSGKLSKALHFDGDEYATVSHDNSLNFGTDSFSVGLWLKTDVAPTGSASVRLVSKNDGATATHWSVYLQGPDADGKYGRFFIDDGPNASLQSPTAGKTFIDGQWHYMVVVFDRDNGEVGIYNDAVLQQSGKLDISHVTGSLDSSVDIDIGRYATGIQYFDGWIDEIKIYNYALTQSEINTDFNQGQSITFGSVSTESDGTTPSNSDSRKYCVPGSTDTCNPPVFELMMDDYVSGDAQTLNDTSIYNNSAATENGGNGTGMDCTQLGYDNNYSCLLDSVDDVVGAGSDTLLDDLHDDAFTVSAWLYPKSGGESGFSRIIEKGVINTNGWGFSLYNSGVDGRLLARIYTDGTDGSCYTSSTAGNILEMNEWNYAVMTYDDAGSRDSGIYLNGNWLQLTCTTATGNISTDATDNMYVGNNSGGANTFDGNIDQVRIYDYVRTPAQIAWEYNRGGPVAWYKFDECTGTNINDWSRGGDGSYNGNNGTLTIGGTGTNTSAGTCSSGTGTEAWNNGTIGKWDSAMDFDGDDDYVDFGSSTIGDGWTEMSICTWMYYNPASVTADGAIISQYDGGIDGWIFWVNDYAEENTADNTISFGVNFATVDTRISGSTDTVTPQQWDHYCGTFKGDTFIRLYKNGNLIAEDSGTLATSVDSSLADKYIGRIDHATSRELDAKLDDLRIYNYALTDSQVKMVMNQGSAVRFD